MDNFLFNYLIYYEFLIQDCNDLISNAATKLLRCKARYQDCTELEEISWSSVTILISLQVFLVSIVLLSKYFVQPNFFSPIKVRAAEAFIRDSRNIHQEFKFSQPRNEP